MLKVVDQWDNAFDCLVNDWTVKVERLASMTSNRILLHDSEHDFILLSIDYYKKKLLFDGYKRHPVLFCSLRQNPLALYPLSSIFGSG